MKKIIFSRKGKCVSDFEINEVLDHFFETSRKVLNISNALIIEEIRARIREGKINPENVDIFVEDLFGDIQPFVMDKDGRSHDWVDSLEIYSNILMRLL